ASAATPCRPPESASLAASAVRRGGGGRDGDRAIGGGAAQDIQGPDPFNGDALRSSGACRQGFFRASPDPGDDGGRAQGKPRGNENNRHKDDDHDDNAPGDVAHSLHRSDAHNSTTNTTARSTIEPVQKRAADPGKEEEALVLNLNGLSSKSESSVEEEELEEGLVKEGTVEEELHQQSMSSSNESGKNEKNKEAPLSPDDPALLSPGTGSKCREYHNPNRRKNKRIRDIKKGKRRH
ncbi:hypothetical protein BG006_004230, partial [Podila minutissima]